MKRSLVFILTVTLSPLVGWTAGVWHATTVARHDTDRRRDATRLSTSLPTSATADQTAAPEPLASPATIPEPQPTDTAHDRDLYGNDVSPAVATYRRDASGSTWEEHSPTTEVSPPKSPTS